MDKQPTPAKRVCVVLDANIWIEQPLLRTNPGKAFLHVLRHLNAIVGLPHVVEHEIIKHAGLKGVEHAEHALAALRQLAPLSSMVVPPIDTDPSTYEGFAAERLLGLESLVHRCPPTEGQLRGAYERVLNCRPPNTHKKPNEFKDSVLWEAVRDLGASHTVHFVTNDHGFYVDERSTSLAENLADEVTTGGLDITIHRPLKAFIAAVEGRRPPLNEEAFLHALLRAVLPEIDQKVVPAFGHPHYEVSRGRLLHSQIDAFTTDAPGQLAVEFALQYELFWTKEGSTLEHKLELQGDCAWDVRTARIRDWRLFEGVCRRRDNSGTYSVTRTLSLWGLD